MPSKLFLTVLSKLPNISTDKDSTTFYTVKSIILWKVYCKFTQLRRDSSSGTSILCLLLKEKNITIYYQSYNLMDSSQFRNLALSYMGYSENYDFWAALSTRREWYAHAYGICASFYCISLTIYGDGGITLLEV